MRVMGGFSSRRLARAGGGRYNKRDKLCRIGLLIQLGRVGYIGRGDGKGFRGRLPEEMVGGGKGGRVCEDHQNNSEQQQRREGTYRFNTGSQQTPPCNIIEISNNKKIKAQNKTTRSTSDRWGGGARTKARQRSRLSHPPTDSGKKGGGGSQICKNHWEKGEKEPILSTNSLHRKDHNMRLHNGGGNSDAARLKSRFRS